MEETTTSPPPPSDPTESDTEEFLELLLRIISKPPELE
jgi:hypothetical protein